MADVQEAQDRFGLEGKVLSDRIEVRYLVAEGGFGLVYRGFHRELGIEVALKVLLPPPELTPAQLDEFVLNFAMEARTLERILHPNIVRVVDTGEAVMPSGHHTGFIALEWIEGVVLEDELEERRGQGGRMPAEVFSLMRGVLDALSMVHREGIAHRDLKPGNIIVSATLNGPLVRLLDFGIAKWMRSDERAGSGRTRTFSNLQAYSPQYASPEQLTGARTGPWTDVHAMGLILSELLTDQPPLEGSNFPQLLASAMNPQRPSPARRRIDVGAWEPVLRKALSIRPDDRFRDAGELLNALEATLPQATKRVMPDIDPDDPALAQTLTSSIAPSAPPSKPAPGPSWLKAPQRPGAPSSPPSVMLSASMAPGEMPRPSTPLVGVSTPPPRPPQPSNSGAYPVGASTLPPPRMADRTGPIAAAPPPRPAPRSALRPVAVLVGGIVVGAGLALAVAKPRDFFDPPAPRPAPPRRGPSVSRPAWHRPRREAPTRRRRSPMRGLRAPTPRPLAHRAPTPPSTRRRPPTRPRPTTPGVAVARRDRRASPSSPPPSTPPAPRLRRGPRATKAPTRRGATGPDAPATRSPTRPGWPFPATLRADAALRFVTLQRGSAAMGLFDAFGVGGGDLSIQVQFPQVQAGAVLNGMVTFAAGRRAQQITNIRVTLNCTTQHFVNGQQQGRSEAVAPPMVVSGPFTAQPGQQYQFPFQVQVPPSAYSSQPNAVSYRVHASADIDGEVDPGAGQDIQVIGTPMGMHAPMQPGMMPMGGPQPGWDPNAGMHGGAYGHGVEHPHGMGYDKAAAMKGGYDRLRQGHGRQGGALTLARQGHGRQGRVWPGYDKAAAMKGGYDPGYDKAVAAKGGYDPGYGQGGFAPGTRAQAQWTDGGWYGVTVLQQQGQQVLVQWDDGTPPSWVGLHQVAL
ncbi:MAG: sporulation protein [Polyangiales bacterium]